MSGYDIQIFLKDKMWDAPCYIIKSYIKQTFKNTNKRGCWERIII